MSLRVTKTVRRLVLWGTFAAAIAAWSASAPPVLLAQAAEPPSPSAQTKPSGDTSAAPADSATKADKAPPSKAAGEDVTISPRGIIIDRGDKHVRVFGADREYDSFEQFAKDAPWLAGLVFFVVSLVFVWRSFYGMRIGQAT